LSFAIAEKSLVKSAGEMELALLLPLASEDELPPPPLPHAAAPNVKRVAVPTAAICFMVGRM
jgi:hypothetical protein